LSIPAEGIALVSAAIAALANVIVAPVANRYGAYQVSAWLSAAVALIFILLSPFVLVITGAELGSTKAILYTVLGAAPILAAGTLLYWESVRRLGISVAFPIASSYPLVASLYGFFFLDEAFSLAKVFGTVAIIGGVSLVSISSSESGKRSTEGTHWKAVLLAFMAMLCWSGNTILIKLAMDAGLGVFTVNLFRMPVIAMLLTTVVIVRHRKASTPRISLRSLSVLGLAALISGAQDLLYFYTLQASDLSIIVPLASTSPLFVTPMAVLFLKERVTLRTLAGTIMTVIGIAVLA
jgi:drug/metabolite transporter (DMT)-like permease